MSQNIYQVYQANPITSNASTDLMYFGQSPYTTGDDAAMTYANFAAQFGAPYTPAALTSSNDTNVTLTLGGSPSTALLHAASITAGWTGTLAVGRGGLGIGTTPTNGEIPIGNGTNYTAATITPGTGISITNGIGTITISSSGSVSTTFDADSGSATPSSNTLTITGSSTGLTTTGSGSTIGMTGTLNAGHGGTGLASLTTYGLITAGTTATGNFQQVSNGSSGQMLQSGGASALPAFSTATYPSTATSTGTVLRANGTNWVASTSTFADTYSASNLLYSNGANTVTGLATANDGVLITSNTGVPSWLANSGTPGYVLTANSGAPPSWQSITAEGAITTIDGDSGSITPAAGVVTISGGTTGLTTSGSSATMDLTGTLNLAHGGSNADLTANAGAVIYSTASAMALSAPGSSGQLFISAGTSAPGWTTSTYPLTNAANTLLYASSANTMAALATADSGVLVTSGAGVPSILAAGTTGQVLQASTSGTPAWSTPTYPTASGSAGQIIRSNGTNNIYSTSTFSDTYSASTLLYSNGANTVTGLATADNGVLITSNTGVPSWLANSSTPGYVLTANSGAPPSWQAVEASGAIETIDGDSGSITPTAGVVTISGGTTGLTTSGSSSTLDLTGTLKLANGGTNANLTASNGGIFYSTATAGAILSGTATAQQLLLSGASTTPQWSTSTYPLTNAANTLLYASSANTMAALATADSAVLVTSSSGVPSWSSTMTNGQVIIGSTSGTPTAATLTAGTGVSITNGAGSITIASSGAAPWVDETGSSVTMTTNTGYTSDDGASLVTFTLPTTSAIGDWVEINGKGSGLWTIAQASGQQIHIGTVSTTSGTGGSLSSVNQYDNVRLRCLTANTIWTVVSQQSSGLTYV